MSEVKVPDDVMAAALKLHADIMGVEKGCCDGVPEAIELAFRAGRESAYTEDEWRVNHPEGGPGMYWGGLAEHLTELLDACRSSYPEAWIEHRRTGATEWVRVSVSQRTEAQ